MRSVAERMLPAIKPGAIVTDVGSVKAGVIQEMEPLVAGAGGAFHWQPSHGRRGKRWG